MTFTIATPTFEIGPFTAIVPVHDSREDAGLLAVLSEAHKEHPQPGAIPSPAEFGPELRSLRKKHAEDCTALVQAYVDAGLHTVVKAGAVRKSLSLSKGGDAAPKNQTPVRSEIEQGVDFEGYDRKIRRQGLNWQTFDTDRDQVEPMPLEPMPTLDSIAAAMRLLS